MKFFDTIEKINFQEIPSIAYDDSMNFSLKNGIHVVINHANRHHKMFIPDDFKTNLYQFYLDSKYFSKFDILAFHIFRYLKERCHLPEYNHRVLWKLLRQSNSFIYAIVKFYLLLKYFYKFSRNI